MDKINNYCNNCRGNCHECILVELDRRRKKEDEGGRVKDEL